MSSVFVRIDEQKQTLWKALIVGPEDTPYAGGCFIFDIYFPSAYPHSSPKVMNFEYLQINKQNLNV